MACDETTDHARKKNSTILRITLLTVMLCFSGPALADKWYGYAYPKVRTPEFCRAWMKRVWKQEQLRWSKINLEHPDSFEWAWYGEEACVKKGPKDGSGNSAPQ